MATRKRSTVAERAGARGTRPLQIEHVPLSSLKPDPTNPRRISEAAKARLKRGLERFGEVMPLVVRKRDRLIIGGHQRYAIEQERGSATVPVVFLDDLTDAETKSLNLLLNNPDAQGSWDLGKLSAILGELHLEQFDLKLTGFDEATIDDLLHRGSREEQAEVLPPTPKRARSKPGEAFKLGEHRLVCGRAEDLPALQPVLRGERAACVYTDPPYGVDYDARDSSKAWAKMAGDDKRRDDLATFLAAAFKTAVHYAREDAAFYIWHASATRKDFELAMASVGLQERQYLIWTKPGMAMNWSDYRWAHEPCFYAALAGQKPPWYGGRDQGTVFRLDPRQGGVISVLVGQMGVLVSDGKGTTLHISTKIPKGKNVRHLRVGKTGGLLLTPERDVDDVWEVSREHDATHPTQKPLALARRALTNSTKPGELVLDLFGGSGNTLLAAELLERRAVLVELDPIYCDVIRQRYADFVKDASFSPTKRLSRERA